MVLRPGELRLSFGSCAARRGQGNGDFSPGNSWGKYECCGSSSEVGDDGCVYESVIHLRSPYGAIISEGCTLDG